MSRREPTGLTRRHVLGAATAAAGAGLLAGPAAAVGRPAAAPVFSAPVGELRGTSPVLAAARRFVMAGLQWAGPATARIELRARCAGGRFSPWALASVRGHEPDRPARGSIAYGEPLWLGPADEVQLRTSLAVSGVRLNFVAADAVGGDAGAGDGPTAQAAALPLAQPILDAGPGQPPIIARQAWAGRDHGPAAGPYYGAIDLAFVHHTDNPNGYSAGQVPAMILAIYLYHRYARGFFDIAYNFVIDAFGRTWEARAGGIDEPVIGAHAGGYNAQSTGVAVLGTFMFAVPPPPAMAALERLLAWKLSLHGLPTLGKVPRRGRPRRRVLHPVRSRPARAVAPDRRPSRRRPHRLPRRRPLRPPAGRPHPGSRPGRRPGGADADRLGGGGGACHSGHPVGPPDRA